LGLDPRRQEPAIGLCGNAGLERGRFLWPSPADGVVTISPAQLGYLLEGIDWRAPQKTSINLRLISSD
jgi:transposase